VYTYHTPCVCKYYVARNEQYQTMSNALPFTYLCLLQHKIPSLRDAMELLTFKISRNILRFTSKRIITCGHKMYGFPLCRFLKQNLQRRMNIIRR
jgi:hypothetical protein